MIRRGVLQGRAHDYKGGRRITRAGSTTHLGAVLSRTSEHHSLVPVKVKVNTQTDPRSAAGTRGHILACAKNGTTDKVVLLFAHSKRERDLRT